MFGLHIQTKTIFFALDKFGAHCCLTLQNFNKGDQMFQQI